MMRVVSMKLILLGVTVCFLLTILYGQYHSNTSQSQQKAFGSRWTEDDEGESVWKLTTATQQHMTEGRCSLRKAVRRDQPMRQLFNFSVPVLQWAGSFHKAAWRRLGDHAPPYGWKGLSVNVVRSSLALLNGSVNSVLFERPLEEQCVRCAVVGNGGILRGSKQGHAIDSHDLVFRVNGAVTKGFEEDVGTKTSFYGFTTNTMKHSLILYRKEGFTRVPQGREVRYIFIPSDLRDYVMMTTALQGLAVPSGEDAGDRPWRYFGHKPPEYFKMIHPDFITYVTQRFLKSPLQSYRRTGHLYMPSTGALMLMMALHTCDQVSAYGFITSNYAEFSDHYYDSVKRPLVFFANHDMKMESRLWDALDRKQVLRLYRRAGGS